MKKINFVYDYVKGCVSEVIDDVIIIVDERGNRHIGGKIVDRGLDKDGAMDIDFILNSVFTGNCLQGVVIHDPVRTGVRRINSSTGEIINDISDKFYWYIWCKLSGLYKKSRTGKFSISKDDMGYMHLRLR